MQYKREDGERENAVNAQYGGWVGRGSTLKSFRGVRADHSLAFRGIIRPIVI